MAIFCQNEYSKIKTAQQNKVKQQEVFEAIDDTHIPTVVLD